VLHEKEMLEVVTKVEVVVHVNDLSIQSGDRLQLTSGQAQHLVEWICDEE